MKSMNTGEKKIAQTSNNFFIDLNSHLKVTSHLESTQNIWKNYYFLNPWYTRLRLNISGGKC